MFTVTNFQYTYRLQLKQGINIIKLSDQVGPYIWTEIIRPFHTN